MEKLEEYKKRVRRVYELPSHAYHPNASLLHETRHGYVARPKDKSGL